jgi:hypothetical protein
MRLGAEEVRQPTLLLAQPGGGTGIIVGDLNYYDLVATAVQPTMSPQIENRPILVSFSITHHNRENDHKGGRVCGVGHWGTCFSLNDLPPGVTRTGQVTTTAPLAGHNVLAHIVFWSPCPGGDEICGPTAEADSPPFDVAAVYYVQLNGVTIKRSRAGPTYNDQVFASLAAQVGPPDPNVNLCQIDAGPNLVYCVLHKNEGFTQAYRLQLMI